MLDDVPILFLAYYAYTYSLDTVTYALQYVFSIVLLIQFI